MNPSSSNLANITNNYKAFLEKQQKYPKKYHILSSEQWASSSALSRMPKTPPTMERSK